MEGDGYHVNDIMFTQVDVDRGGEGSPIERMSLRPSLVVSTSSTGGSNVHFCFSTNKTCPRNVFFRWTVGRPGNEANPQSTC